ncbi:MAG TPA: hypothetical protein GX722_04330, partial [Clostridiales bacterium]|nr:hypothetical protein [Clostridiales bacterium]
MQIRALDPTRDIPAVLALWNGCVAAREVVYAPMSEAAFQAKFLDSPHYAPELSLVAIQDDAVVGFINGVCK